MASKYLIEDKGWPAVEHEYLCISNKKHRPRSG